jgi:predicted dehydrogenase
MNTQLSRREFVKTATVAALASSALPAIAADEPKTITMAFVGCAHIHTPQYVTLLGQRKDVKVKSVWDPEAARAEKYAKPLNAKVVKNADDIWNDPEITAVVITSETNRHPELISAAAKARKHMFAEKPLGITAQESYAMADAIEKANLLFTTGYFMRADPKHIFLKDEIAKGNLGKITRARGSNCHNGSLGGWFDTDYRWMADTKISGIGGFGDLGTHKLDILMWLLGDVETATAELKAVTNRYGDVDECGEGLIKFKSGVIATLGAGWVDVADPVTLLISGTEGHAMILDDRLYYKTKKVEGADGKEPFGQLPRRSKAPMDQFVDAVAGAKDQPLVTPREAAARVAVMEAMYKGSKDHTWVKPV